jgi:hypothetical protein
MQLPILSQSARGPKASSLRAACVRLMNACAVGFALLGFLAAGFCLIFAIARASRLDLFYFLLLALLFTCVAGCGLHLIRHAEHVADNDDGATAAARKAFRDVAVVGACMMGLMIWRSSGATSGMGGVLPYVTVGVGLVMGIPVLVTAWLLTALRHEERTGGNIRRGPAAAGTAAATGAPVAQGPPAASLRGASVGLMYVLGVEFVVLGWALGGLCSYRIFVSKDSGTALMCGLLTCAFAGMGVAGVKILRHGGRVQRRETYGAEFALSALRKVEVLGAVFLTILIGMNYGRQFDFAGSLKDVAIGLGVLAGMPVLITASLLKQVRQEERAEAARPAAGAGHKERRASERRPGV